MRRVGERARTEKERAREREKAKVWGGVQTRQTLSRLPPIQAPRLHAVALAHCTRNGPRLSSFRYDRCDRCDRYGPEQQSRFRRRPTAQAGEVEEAEALLLETLEAGGFDGIGDVDGGAATTSGSGCDTQALPGAASAAWGDSPVGARAREAGGWCRDGGGRAPPGDGRRPRLPTLSVTASTFNAIISGLGKRGKTERAEAVLELMTRLGVRPTLVSYNALAAAHAAKGDMDATERVLGRAAGAGLQLDRYSYGALLHSCGRAAAGGGRADHPCWRNAASAAAATRAQGAEARAALHCESLLRSRVPLNEHLVMMGERALGSRRFALLRRAHRPDVRPDPPSAAQQSRGRQAAAQAARQEQPSAKRQGNWQPKERK